MGFEDAAQTYQCGLARQKAGGAYRWLKSSCTLLLTAALSLSGCSSSEKAQPSGAADSPAADSAEVSTDTASQPGDTSQPSPDTAQGVCERPVSEEELALYRGYFPEVECGNRVSIPEAHLPSADIELGNVDVVVLLGVDGAVLGQGRYVYTPVYCGSGVCEAVIFVLVFQPDTTFLDIFHPVGAPLDLKKYWEDQYLVFSDEDMGFLRAQLADPPAVLLAVPDTDSLVDGTYGTAPTFPEYQPFVVRGAAFTCYIILDYMVRTRGALAEILELPDSGGER